MGRYPDFNQMKEYFEAIVADYAKKKGVFPDLVAGNLTDKKATPVARQFTFDTSCGDASISDDGTATVKKFKGNTTNPNQLVMDSNLNKANGDGLINVTDGTANDASGIMYGKSYVKNQLTNKTSLVSKVQDGLTFTANTSDGTFVINGTATQNNFCGFQATEHFIVKNHKYLFVGCPSGGGDNTYFFGPYGISIDKGNGGIFTQNLDLDYFNLRLDYKIGATFNNTIFRPQVIDLTQWFGSDDTIPADLLADPTLWETKYWHGGYIDYDTGTIVNNNSKWQATGKNLWSYANGVLPAYTYLKDYKSFESTQAIKLGIGKYYVNKDCYIQFWEDDETHSHISAIGIVSSFKLGVYVYWDDYCITDNGSGFWFEIKRPCVATICSKLSTNEDDFQLELGETATEYEPYHDGGTVDCTDLELKGVGDVYDEFDSASGKITRRFGIVKLKDLNWGSNSEKKYFNVTVNDLNIKSSTINTYIGKLISKEYNVNNFYNIYWNIERSLGLNKVISVRTFDGNTTLCITDLDFTDATDFKNHFTDDDILIYELATATSETVTPQPLETKLGVNSFFETDGDVDYNATLAYQGTHYDISLLSSHKYFFRDKSAGTESVITGLTSQTVDALPNGTGDNLCDLTRWFGSGNEPADPAALYHIYPLLRNPISGTPGVLVSYKGTSIATVGFNQWDEEWEIGSFHWDTGEPRPSVTGIRSKNFIKVFPNTSYYFKGTSLISILGFDENKNVIQLSVSPEYKDIAKLNTSWTTPNNCYYLKIYTSGTTYNHDICINLSWSGYRNGEYEEYWRKVLDLSRVQNIYRHATKGYIVGGEFTAGWLSLTDGGTALTPVTGNLYKVMTQGDYYNSIYKWNGTVYVLATEQEKLLFPDGLCSAGNVYDEVTSTGAIRRVGKIDLGTLNYTKSVSPQRFEAITPLTNFNANLYLTTNAKCSVYNCTPLSVAGSEDKSFYVAQTGYIRIYDSTRYNLSETEFKQVMSGVYLIYELATPEVVTFDDNADTGSANQTSELDLSYDVADFGTEESLPESDTVIPEYAPLLADIAYSSDFTRQIATMYKNYQSQDSMDALLTVIGNALGGTITKTWDEAAGKWSYTFTQN